MYSTDVRDHNPDHHDIARSIKQLPVVWLVCPSPQLGETDIRGSHAMPPARFWTGRVSTLAISCWGDSVLFCTEVEHCRWAEKEGEAAAGKLYR